MKKLFKLGITLAVASMMVVVGVFAAIAAMTFNVSSRVYFRGTEDVRVDVNAHVIVGSQQTKYAQYNDQSYYTGQSGDDIVSKDLSAWEVGDIGFDSTRTITYVIEFKNARTDYNLDITIDIVLDTVQVAGILEGKGSFNHLTGEDKAKFEITIPGAQGGSTSAIFEYTLTLSDTANDLGYVNFGMNITLEKGNAIA